MRDRVRGFCFMCGCFGACWSVVFYCCGLYVCSLPVCCFQLLRLAVGLMSLVMLYCVGCIGKHGRICIMYVTAGYCILDAHIVLRPCEVLDTALCGSTSPFLPPSSFIHVCRQHMPTLVHVTPQASAPSLMCCGLT